MKGMTKWLVKYRRWIGAVLLLAALTAGVAHQSLNEMLRAKKTAQQKQGENSDVIEAKPERAPLVEVSLNAVQVAEKKAEPVKALNVNAPAALPVAGAHSPAASEARKVTKSANFDPFDQGKPAATNIETAAHSDAANPGVVATAIQRATDGGSSATVTAPAFAFPSSLSSGNDVVPSFKAAPHQSQEDVESEPSPGWRDRRAAKASPVSDSGSIPGRILPRNGMDRAKAGELRFAPFGRQIPCRLRNTVESSNSECPIVGEVLEDLYWNGKLIIPAGSEVHGRASVDTQRERIVSSTDWRIILPRMIDLPSGSEVRVQAKVLNQNSDTSGLKFGISDGSYGIQGTLIKTTDLDQIKVFAASFLSSYASSLQTMQATGTNGALAAAPNPRNASLSGASSVLNEWAKQIQAEIAAKGFYIRVPAGKPFYLYIEQTLVPVESADIPLPLLQDAYRQFEVNDAQHQHKIKAIQGDDSDAVNRAIDRSVDRSVSMRTTPSAASAQ